MANFWQALGGSLKIAGKAIMAAEPFIAPVITAFDPPLGVFVTNIAGKIEAAIASVEATVTEAGKGDIKQTMVISDWTSALALATAITGKKFTYDDAKLKQAINDSVTAKNSMAAFIATVKEVS